MAGELVAVRAGLRNVAQIEGLTPGPTGTVEQFLRRMVPALVVRRGVSADGASTDLFVGRTGHAVDEAIRCVDIMRRPPDRRSEREAARRMGRLLGYPSCCVEAFVTAGTLARDSYAWMQLRLRLAVNGEVSPLLAPGPNQLLSHVPCTLGCARSIDLAERMLAAVRQAHGDATADELRRAFDSPRLVLLDRDNEVVELVSTDLPTSRLRYRPGAANVRSPEGRLVLAGTEIDVDEERLTVLRDGQPLVDLAGRAFVWWYVAPVQAALLRALLARRSAAASERRPAPGDAHTDDDPMDRARRLADAVREALRHEPGGPRSPYRLESVEPRRNGDVLLSFASLRGPFRVAVSSRAAAGEAYATAGPVSVHCPRGERIDLPEKVELIRSVVERLAAHYHRPTGG